MSGLEPIAIAALVGGTALSATSQVMGGYEKAAAAEFEADQYRTQAQQARTAAAQDEAAKRRDLTSNLEAVQAIRAGRGVGSASPTGMAIFDNAVNLSEDDIATSRANYLSKADLSNRASILSSRKASGSILAGYIGGATAVADGAFKGATLGKYQARSA